MGKPYKAPGWNVEPPKRGGGNPLPVFRQLVEDENKRYGILECANLNIEFRNFEMALAILSQDHTYLPAFLRQFNLDISQERAQEIVDRELQRQGKA